MKLKAIIREAEEGGFWAEVPSLPGCVTQADSLEELKVNLQEAVTLWLEAGEEEIVLEPQTQIMEVAL
jgi:predicted RNase H-like HicB family nuclease